MSNIGGEYLAVLVSGYMMRIVVLVQDIAAHVISAGICQSAYRKLGVDFVRVRFDACRDLVVQPKCCE